MRRTAVSLIVLLAATGCTTGTDTVEEPVVVRMAPSPPPTDPRVSEMQVLVAELIDQIEVLNARVKKLEGGEVAEQPAVVRRTETPSTQTASRTTPTPTPAPRATPRPTPLPARTVQAAPVSAANAPERYREALVLFGKGQINDSRALFQAVLDSDPNGDLADNALFWIGETYFVSGRYREAIEQYRRIGTDYSSQNKAPDALLKIGLAQEKLGDIDLARRTMESLIERYPYSTAAAAAKAEINRLRY